MRVGGLASLKREPSEGQRTSHQCFVETDRSVRQEGTQASAGPRRANNSCKSWKRAKVDSLGCRKLLGHRKPQFNPTPEGRSDATQVQFLQQVVNKLQEEKDALAEELHGPCGVAQVRQRVSPSHIPEVVPPMPTLIPHDLRNWILDRHSDLQEAISAGDVKQVLELTSQSQGAEKLAELTGGMVV